MTRPTSAGAAALLMGSSRLGEGPGRDAQEPANALHGPCNGRQNPATLAAPVAQEPERTGTVRDTGAPELATTPATLTKAALIAECRRLRVEDGGLTLRAIGERLGMSERWVWKHAGDLAFVNRQCECGETFTAKRETVRKVCDGCRARESARLAAKRNALICDRCKTTLLRPAALCNFCDPDFDLEAALAALTNEERSAVTERSTQREAPR